jgi:hypothetical protein
LFPLTSSQKLITDVLLLFFNDILSEDELLLIFQMFWSLNPIILWWGWQLTTTPSLWMNNCVLHVIVPWATVWGTMVTPQKWHCGQMDSTWASKNGHFGVSALDKKV